MAPTATPTPMPALAPVLRPEEVGAGADDGRLGNAGRAGGSVVEAVAVGVDGSV